MPHQIVSCPECPDIFVNAPGECPDCGASVPAPPPEPEPTVRPYRLNRLGAAGGVAVGGLVTATASLAIGRPAIAIGLLLLGLVVASVLLLWR